MAPTPDVLEHLRELRREAGSRVAQFEASVRELGQLRNDSDTDDEHDPEGTTVTWERATQDAGARAAREHLAELDAAIARVEAGWDGTCRGCGRPIPAERLVARPSADQCVTCAARHR
ncbi:RNA polymerase-binding transcription factor DksA [Kineosphaera limosa]|uniref:Zinc finger DksA/TraR C4-type domain-containing protein n=1 Tax=Kineosphaera limosa NBRC 100340 TaxID=1184609 RepID=K6WVY0_9MICO|nr:TraR/DksA C4-type zinc finger protein [Kineosphaera limosa]NYE03229.1 RNA polymerase-binding transcription factor DksA [Kineosphaera limosa]GAB96247.1 hypothetical protein KILIM_033_00670 [Kineosphaera limosa NBRC 100340]